MPNVSKVILNGTTLMDATGATATMNEIVAPYTAMTADGVMTTGIAGGGGNDWTLLHDSTTTEDGNLSVAVTNISVTEFMVIIECKPISNVVIYIPVNRTDGTHYDTQYGRPYISTGTTTGASKYGWVHIYHQMGPVLPVEKSGDALEYAGGAPSAKNQVVIPSATIPYSEKYTAISVATYQPVSSGTRIIVYGK